MTFQLDTSGAVAPVKDVTDPSPGAWYWEMLTPFAQGYVEALFASEQYGLFSPGNHGEPPAFSDLASETLARIIADCEKVCALYGFTTGEEGAAFWGARQEKPQPLQNVFRETFGAVFPPLTVILGDDGKVRFK